MENYISLTEQPGRAQGEEVGCARPGADEVHDSFHRRRNSGTGRAAEAW